MATKKYTVTLPEELAEEIRTKVGPGAFSAYVTQAVRRQHERDQLGELVDWLENEYGPVTDAELAAAEEKHRGYERHFAERKRATADTVDASDTAKAADPIVFGDTSETAVTSDTDHAGVDHPLAA
jgi:Arc/MetJ-type ribon-helix-helix transcriptional regulator